VVQAASLNQRKIDTKRFQAILARHVIEDPEKYRAERKPEKRSK
jgi:hypothetical protein